MGESWTLGWSYLQSGVPGERRQRGNAVLALKSRGAAGALCAGGGKDWALPGPCRTVDSGRAPGAGSEAKPTRGWPDLGPRLSAQGHGLPPWDLALGEVPRMVAGLSAHVLPPARQHPAHLPPPPTPTLAPCSQGLSPVWLWPRRLSPFSFVLQGNVSIADLPSLHPCFPAPRLLHSAFQQRFGASVELQAHVSLSAPHIALTGPRAPPGPPPPPSCPAAHREPGQHQPCTRPGRV